ncbi:hypothetical protein J4479_03585 [Candidatus Woesearchaeota archaeon]|nr:hypothetical protein [Candidatus Woesearchaeota archaeon]
MAKVEIVRSLFEEIKKKFKAESYEIIDLLESLETSPNKGKLLGTIGGIAIKELKYNNFRFYLITDGFKIKCINKPELIEALIKFVRMSDKKHQQQTITEIKYILKTMGPKGFL